MLITTPNGRTMTASEAAAHLSAERLALRQRHLQLMRTQRELTAELASVRGRLVTIDHAFGLLGLPGEVR